MREYYTRREVPEILIRHFDEKKVKIRRVRDHYECSLYETNEYWCSGDTFEECAQVALECFGASRNMSILDMNSGRKLYLNGTFIITEAI